MRTPLIAGNWKMNGTIAEAEERVASLLPRIATAEHVDVAVCVPFTALQAVVDSTRGSRLAVHAQNMHHEPSGAFTGEVSAPMLTEIDVHGVVLGHSERRQYFGESDDVVNLKLKTALEHGLTPIVCVGEVLEEREAGLTEDVLRRQCLRAFHAISGKKAARLIVAYEPVWAIGTGKTATPQLAADAHALIRAEAAKAFGEDFAEKLRILYGGSVKPDNVTGLMAQEEIDGALVGGASLDPASFAKIVNF